MSYLSLVLGVVVGGWWLVVVDGGWGGWMVVDGGGWRPREAVGGLLDPTEASSRARVLTPGRESNPLPTPPGPYKATPG